MHLPIQNPGRLSTQQRLVVHSASVWPAANPPDVPADWKLCCGDDQYRKYVGPDNTNRCYEKQPSGKWRYTFGSRCDAHDHECFIKVCLYQNS